MRRWGISIGIGVLAACDHAAARADAPDAPQQVRVTLVQLFAIADAARDHADYTTAEAAYRALTGNPDIEVRTEARFRLAMMFSGPCHKPRQAAVLLRQILDEKPQAANVRIELARIDAMLGHLAAAGRELRAAQAAGLPPEIDRLVRFYSQALDAHRPVGGSIELTIAPDSNINRATASSSLATAIGNFNLSNDAQAHSGLGLDVRGQSFARVPITSGIDLLAQLSGSASMYRTAEFDDMIVSPQIGPDITLGKGKLNIALGSAWRWYGTQPYSFSRVASADWQHPVGRRAQIRLDAGFAAITNRRDALESGNAWSASAAVDRAFSARFGGGLQLSGLRQTAQDPGYATASGGITGYVFREIGKTTMTVTTSYAHLAADQRLFLFPDRRIDNTYGFSVSGVFRQIRVGTIAPLVRFRFERNASTVQLYDYRRVSGELGITTAF